MASFYPRLNFLFLIYISLPLSCPLSLSTSPLPIASHSPSLSRHNPSLSLAFAIRCHRPMPLDATILQVSSFSLFFLS